MTYIQIYGDRTVEIGISRIAIVECGHVWYLFGM